MIYADNAATTKLDIEAFEAMKPFLLEEYGNASQPYFFSKKANRIPNDCGGIYVYVIVSPIIPNGGNYLMYIGKATKTESENLRARVRTYKKQFGEKYNRPKLHNMFTKWGEYVYVYYLPMKSSAADIKEIEDRLIAAYGRPPCNKEILIRSVKDAVDAAF